MLDRLSRGECESGEVSSKQSLLRGKSDTPCCYPPSRTGGDSRFLARSYTVVIGARRSKVSRLLGRALILRTESGDRLTILGEVYAAPPSTEASNRPLA